MGPELNWISESFTRGELDFEEAPAFEDLLVDASLTAIDRFNRSLYTEEAGLVGRFIHSVPGVVLTWEGERRKIAFMDRRNKQNESSLVSMCTTVRRRREYRRVNPSTESAEPAQAAIERTHRNSNVRTIAFMFIALDTRAIAHSNQRS